MIYSWQQNTFQQVWHAKQQQRLPHALLFTGIAGIGKYDFALHFAQALLCPSNIDGMPCSHCHACRLVRGQTHPNLLLITPEQAGHAIKVDQVRMVRDFVCQSSLQGEYRIVIIHPAHNMNDNAANALLKTLEEPAANAILILLSDQCGQLPATILSRCQRVLFPAPTREQALSWLQTQVSESSKDCQQLLNIAEGAPLLALQLAEDGEEALTAREALFKGLCTLTEKPADVLNLATNLQDFELPALLHYFTSWLVDLLRIQVASGENLLNADYSIQLQQLSSKASAQQYVYLMGYLQQLRQQLNAGINFNKQLLLESLLIRWVECFKCS